MRAGARMAALRALTVLLGITLAGCGLEPRSRLLPNQPPEITLARPTPLSDAEGELAFTLRWSAHDTDGRLSHYLFALDPRSVDRVDQGWSRSQETATAARFPRNVAVGRAAATAPRADEPHVFAVRAVDEAGARSSPATVAFFGENIAPEVQIVDPQPNAVFTPITGQSVEIRWTGDDPDGHITKYKYRLFSESNPDFPEIPAFISFAVSNPDSFRRLYAPAFASWDSVGPEVQSVRYAGLTPERLYLFAITAFDDAGDYAPVFSITSSLLKFAVTADDGAKPFLCVAGPYFDFCATYPADVDLEYEMPCEATIPVTWSATAYTGSTIRGYRWVLDPLDVGDEKSRSHAAADPNHWTPWSLDATTATIGPFHSRPDLRDEHVLHIQARDSFDRVSTFRVHLKPVCRTQERDLLVVDDTRLTPDQIGASGALDPPRGTWPSAAELDTFLYARGGVPWRGYPPGSLSRPGILNGYDFDTLGTRGLLSGIVPLSKLGQYRQVIWITDDVGATYSGSPLDLLSPVTSLRLMNSSGQANTLAAYVSQGGKLWLMGGGAAYATLINWGARNTPPDEWSHDHGELVAGRFMYDYAHWRSDLAVRPARLLFLHTTNYAQWPNAQVGRGWSGHGMDRSLSQPDYSKLAALPVLSGRTCATDPPSPLRACNSFYLLDRFQAEYIGRHPLGVSNPRPNFVWEDADPRPNHERLESTLDTLYLAASGTILNGPWPTMTYYHGFESGPVVFSGFPIWFFQRAQARVLVDFVLQDIWGLPKRAGAPTTAALRR